MSEDSFSINDVEAAHKIIAYLLEKGDIISKDQKLLRLYENQDIRTIVEMLAKEMNVTILAGADFIYMLPNSDNTYLGYTAKDFQEKLAKGGVPDDRRDLAFFAITVLLVEFYNSDDVSCLSRQYLHFKEYHDAIDKYLKKGAANYSNEDQDASGILFKEMNQAYESLTTFENREDAKPKIDKRIKNTKKGFLTNILEFLQKHNLITYIKDEGKIYPTPKLTNVMSYYILARQNYESFEHFQTVKYVLSEIDNEQDQ